MSSSKLRQQFERGSNFPFSSDDKVQTIRKAKERQFYAYTFDQRDGRHPLSLALDFFIKDGNRFGIFYMEITSPVLYSLGSGATAQSVTIRTSTAEITIKGKNLSPIYEYILEQRLVWLKEPDTSFVETGEDEPEIEEIELKERQ